MLDVLDRLINWLLGIALIVAVIATIGRDPYLLMRDAFTARRKTRFLRRGKHVSATERLLRAVSGEKANVRRFWMLSASVGVVAFALIAALSGRITGNALLMGLCVGLLPLLFRWVQLQSHRVKASYEGMDVVTTLNNCYIITSKNMVMALDMAVTNLKNCPYSKRNIAALTMAIKQARSEDDVREALDMFEYTYQTEWVRILTFCIYNGIVDSADVSGALSSLIEQFRRAKVVMEKSKRYNREGFLVLQILVPVVYLGLMGYGAGLFNVPFLKVMKTQITNPMGIKMLAAMLGMYAACWAIGSILKRPKYDL